MDFKVNFHATVSQFIASTLQRAAHNNISGCCDEKVRL